MSKSVMKIILVISYENENPDEIAAKYAAETKVAKHVFLTKKDCILQKQQLETLLLNMLQNKNLQLTSHEQEQFKDRYWQLKNMSVDDYFLERTINCESIDDEQAYTTKNDSGYYLYPKCYQFKLDTNGEEADFSTPFKLKDGSKAYRAYYNDIDWSLMHNHGTSLYQAAWELCVEDREPLSEQEEDIKNRLSNRLTYFLQFKDKDEYVTHNTSFFTHGVATNEWYKEVNYAISDIDWVASYFDTYIKPIKNNPLLSIYEVRSLKTI